MRALAGERLLIAWERSRAAPSPAAALALLELGLPGHPAAELAQLPLGERNALLLELRTATLGRRMAGFAVCPACGAQLEFELDACELAAQLRLVPPAGAAAPAPLDGYAMRPANTLDLLASSAAANAEQARCMILARTLDLAQAQSAHGAEEWFSALPGQLTAQLLEAFEHMNVNAEIRVQLLCAVCRERPALDLDIAQFLVREITGAARRLLAQVHELAGAYGWSERSITAMSELRRGMYLQMLNA